MGVLSSFLGLKELLLWSEELAVEGSDFRQLSGLTGLNRLARPLITPCHVQSIPMPNVLSCSTWDWNLYSSMNDTIIHREFHAFHSIISLNCINLRKRMSSACVSCSHEQWCMLSLCLDSANSGWSHESSFALSICAGNHLSCDHQAANLSARVYLFCKAGKSMFEILPQGEFIWAHTRAVLPNSR